MRVLFIGGIGANKGEGSVESVLDGLEMTGHEYVEVPSSSIKRARGGKALLQHLKNLKPDTFDAILACGPSGMEAKWFSWLAKCAPTVFWTKDDPMQEVRGAPYYRRCQGVMTCCVSSAKRYQNEGRLAVVAYPAINIKKGRWHLHAIEHWKCDVGLFLGHKYSRAQFPRALATRDELDKALSSSGLNYKRFGVWLKSDGWSGRTNTLPHEHHGKWIPYDWNSCVYLSCKVNIGTTAVPTGDRYYNERMMHCLGSGAFFLSDRIKNIEEDFTPGIHLDVWTNVRDLVEKARYYVNNDELREKIAHRGYERACKYHSNVVFAKKFTNLVKRIREAA
jgi:hypothetical protein